MPKRVGSSDVNMTSSMERRGLEATALERAHCFEAAQDSDSAVVHSGVRDRIGVGAGGYGGQAGFCAGPADEDIADGIVADFEAFRWSRVF